MPPVPIGSVWCLLVPSCSLSFESALSSAFHHHPHHPTPTTIFTTLLIIATIILGQDPHQRGLSPTTGDSLVQQLMRIAPPSLAIVLYCYHYPPVSPIIAIALLYLPPLFLSMPFQWKLIIMTPFCCIKIIGVTYATCCNTYAICYTICFMLHICHRFNR